MAKIHPTSVVADGAEIDDSVEIGPLCYVGPNVKIGANTRLIRQCNIDGFTTLGKNNEIHPFASLGQPAQDRAAKTGDETYLNIGDNNIFRECCAIHTGTAVGSATTIGNNCMFMNSAHLAHNCTVGNNVIIVSGAVIGGHCKIYDNAFISGVVAIHQFCRVGRFAIISGGSVFSQDVPPFMMVEGRNGYGKTINKVGLIRGGVSAETINVIKKIHKIYYRSNLSSPSAIEKIKAELPQIPEVLEFIEFCETTKRGIPASRRDFHRM